MSNISNADLINEKLKEIERLKAEIKSLKEPAGIAGGVKCGMWAAWRWDGKVGTRFYKAVGNCGQPWIDIRALCLLLYSYRYGLSPRQTKVNMLDERELNTARAMAEELVTIWNKYFEMEYGEREGSK